MITRTDDAAPGRLWLRGEDLKSLLGAVPPRNSAAFQEIDTDAQAGDRVPLADYFRLTRAHAFARREESLGLAPRPLVAGTTDFVMAQAASGGALLDALRRVADAYNTLHGGAYNFVELDEHTLTYRVDDSKFPYTRLNRVSITLLMECVLIYLHGVACSLAGEDLTPAIRRVSTRRITRSGEDPLGFWSCPTDYDAPSYAISYDRDVATRPVTQAHVTEEAVHNRILMLIEKRECAIGAAPVFAAQVRQLMRDGVRDQKDAARRLGCSVPTLRRKLAQEGHSFRALRQEILNEAAKLHLLDATRIADVADDLGFSDTRSFTRAFKHWNGAGPKLFRRRKPTSR